MNKNYPKIPDEKECYRLMDEYQMLPNIVEHSRQVMNVALVIADNLKEKNTVNRDLVIAASLLHDITKTQGLTTGEPHDKTGAELLRSLDMPEIAYIVGEHVFFTNFNPKGPVEEREIVYYADKRVMHHTIVTVDLRINDLLSRYGTTPDRRERILLNSRMIYLIDEKLQRNVHGNLEQLISRLPTL